MPFCCRGATTSRHGAGRQPRPRAEAISRTGLVVGVWTGGNEVDLWHRGELPAGPASIFEIGSITKVFTGTLLADMAQEGLVGLGDRVSLHLPPGVEMPSRGREITLTDLASHRSGLPAVPRSLLLKALMTRGRDPYADWDAARLEAAIPAHAPATRAGEALRLLELRGRATRPPARPARGHELRRARTATHLHAARPPGYGHERRRRQARHRPQAGRPRDAALAARRARRRGRSALDRHRPARLSCASTPTTAARRSPSPPARHSGRARSSGAGTSVSAGGSSRRAAGCRSSMLVHEGGTGGFRSFAGLAPGERIGVVVLANQARGVGAARPAR